MNPKVRTTTIAVSLLIITVSLWTRRGTDADARLSATATISNEQSRMETVARNDCRPLEQEIKSNAHHGTVVAVTNAQEASKFIEDTLAALRSGDAARRSDALDRLDDFFSRSEPAASIEAIVDFLASGRDAATGEAFAVSVGGVLAQSPTFRVFLLDQLGLLCAANGSDEALNVACDILRDFTAPDEWAVAMRNIAWLAPEATPFLEDRMRAMLDHAAWLRAPGGGFLNVFDVIVRARVTGLIPRLCELLNESGDEIDLAAAAALYGLGAASPEATARAFNDHPELLGDKPRVRAEMLATANLSHEAERREVERYLDRADVPAAEKEWFFFSLIAPPSFAADNPLTQAVKAPAEDARRFTTLAQTAGEWLSAGAFPDLHEELEDLLEIAVLSAAALDEKSAEPNLHP